MGGQEQEAVFRLAKESQLSNKLLVHFNPNNDIVVSCDISPYWLGELLSHRMLNGSEKPVHSASHILSSYKKGYSQLHREGLAIIFAVRKILHFLYGRTL